MGLMSVSIENPYFMTMVITMLGFILRSSPQLLIMRFDDGEGNIKQQMLLLKILEGSVLFSQIIIVLIFIGIIVSQYVILRFFRGLIVGQIMIKLLFPFQVYLALSLFNQRSQNQSNSGYLVIMILSAIIVQSITTIFQYRFHSGKYTKNLSINKIYERLWQVNLLLPAFASLFISNHYQLTIILIILILLNALKSTLFSCQIIYQTPVLQYCGYIGQFCSWMTIIQLSMFIFFDINPFTLQCINLIIVFCLIFKPHKQLIALMEVKYMRQFKKQESFQNSIQNSILNLNSNTSSEKSMYTLMKKISTVVFVQGELQMAKNSLMDRSNIVQQERPFFNFSQSFMHEIKQSKYMNEHKQNLNLDNEENQQQYLNIWYYIENNPILLTKRFYNFQRFLIYCLPVQNNLSHLRLVQLFYSWFNQMEDEVFTSTQHSNSFRQIIHRRLDYMFLRERIDSQFTFEKKFIQNGIDTKRQIMQDNQKKIFCLSFKQEKFFNWKFQQSFDQAEFQERIHKEMSVFIQTQEQLINLLTCTQIKKKFKIFSQLIQRSDKKNRIFSIFDEYNISRRSIKCTIYEYMITKFILKLPRLATRELRQRMEIITRDSVQLLDEDKTKFNVIISGMREKGYIIHTCSMFKQKMEIKQQREDYKESKRIHINDLMMKFYSQKHLEALEGLNYMSESMRKFHNTRRKGLFMASLVTQRLYQVSFTINFMTRSMHDIYLVMDMTYKEVGSLTVYKNDIKVFQKKSPVVIIKSQPSISTSSRSSFQPREKSKIISANEKIFDESYLFEFEYIDSTQLQEDTERKSSNQKYIEQEQFQARLLQTKEKDLQSYRNQTYFNQGYWTIFTILMFLIPIVLTLMTYILANLAAQNQQQNKNFYMTNYNVQNQFFLTDLKSFNIFFVFNIFKAPYILFENMRQRVAFFDSWKFQLDEELNNIHSRGIKVVEDILRPNTMTPFLFAPLSETQTSFLFRKQRYDGQITDILHSFGNISTIKQFQNTGSISKKIPNQGEFYQLERFYNFNLHLFEKYTKPESGIFPKINILVHDSLENQRMLFGNISIGIILLWVIGGILFVFIFIKLKYRVLDMVSKSFIFNQSNFKMMIERLAQFKQLLKVNIHLMQTSERSSSCTLVNKIGIASNKKVSDDSRVLSNTAFKRSDNFQQPKMNVLKHSWPQILIFLLIVFGFSMIIYSFNNDSASEIHLMEKYLSGTQQLVEVTGKTLYLFNCLIDSLLSPNPINPLIPTYIEQVISVDRAAILRKLFPSQQTLHNITFNPMCLQHEEMNCYKDQYVRQNYMQTMGRIIHLSSGLYKTMLKAGKYGNINEEPILQLYSQVNLMTKMIRQILYDIEVNFISELQNMTVYIYYVCAYLILYCLVIAWWTWTQTYTKNKIYSIQVLSLVSYQEMIRISDFHFYLHDIQNQQWVENHDHY